MVLNPETGAEISSNLIESGDGYYANIAGYDKENNWYIAVNAKFELVCFDVPTEEINIPPQKIELHKEEIVPMLTIQFVNTDLFNRDDDIYNYIAIDSSIVFTLACVDMKMNVKAFAHFLEPVSGYYEIDKRSIN